MKKTVLILLIILVTLGIGLVLYMQFTRTNPVYAGSEKTVIYEGTSLCAANKYYAGLAEAEVNTALADVADNIEGAVTAYDAILAKGTPVFHPTFYINVTDSGTDYFRVTGEAADEPMDGQQQVGFYCENLTLDIYTDGNSQIISLRSVMPSELEKITSTLPVIADDGLSASAVCDAATTYDLNLAFLDEKNSTTVTFEWKYNVKSNAPLNLSGISEQSLVVDVIFTAQNGTVSAQFA